jgi:hypothetical protein
MVLTCLTADVREELSTEPAQQIGIRSIARTLRSGPCAICGEINLKMLIGTRSILTDWVSGRIRLSAGEIVEYVQKGYHSTFEYGIVVKVRKGVVVKELEVKNMFDNHESIT